MERSICKIIIFALFPLLAYSQNNEQILSFFVSNKMNEWKSFIDNNETQYRATSEQKLEFVNYQYGYIAWCVGKKKYDEAKKYIEKAENTLNELEKIKFSLSSVYAYRAAFLGFKVAMSPLKAPFLGPKSVSNAENALKLSQDNWFAHLQMGNIKFYSPSIVGGSKSEALNHYLRAKKILEANDAFYKSNWNYLNLLVGIANTYIELDNLDLAKKYYDAALLLYPNFHWVKNELYPELNKKIKSKNAK